MFQSTMMGRAKINVSGRVQGVFFREEAKRRADELGITGWINNKSDGSVKIIAEGDNDDLQQLIAWCSRGTDLAKVESVDVEWEKASGEFTNFEIKL